MKTPLTKIIVVLGPTASGKSDLAVKIARQFNGEVISADSRQVYRGLDLGSGKIPKDKSKVKSPRPRLPDLVSTRSRTGRLAEGGQKSKPQLKNQNYLYKGIQHYLLDVANPKRRFTVAQYKKLAQKAIKNILSRGKLPIICGGTGFYIQALIDNINIPEVKPNFKMRAKLEKIATKELYGSLQKLDPERAKNIDSNNRRRLIRALEIVLTTGQPIPVFSPLYKRGVGGDFETLLLGLKKSPQELSLAIKKRLQKRLKQGMIREVKNLHQNGLSWKRLESFGLEYQQIARFLQNKISYDKMIYRIQKDSEHLAKRQMTWFKKDSRISWISDYKKIAKLVKKFIQTPISGI